MTLFDIISKDYANFIFVGANNPMGKIENFAPNTLAEIPLYYPHLNISYEPRYGLCGVKSQDIINILQQQHIKYRRYELYIEPFRCKQINPYFNLKFINLIQRGLAAYIDNMIGADFILYDRESTYPFTHSVIEIKINAKWCCVDPTNCIIYPISVVELIGGQYSYNMFPPETRDVILHSNMIQAATLYFCSKTFWNSVYNTNVLYI